MKKYLLTFLLGTGLSIVSAQINIQPVIPMAGVIQKSTLWNIVLTNTSLNTFECRLELTIRERTNGMEVMTATTGSFQMSGGAKQLNANFLLPIQYNYIAPSFSSRTDDFIPIGDYIACYRLTYGKDITAEECVSFDVEPLSPPMLINPADSSVLDLQPSQFAWIPPSPTNLFSRLQYEVLITEIQPGQKAEEAMQQNLPFYTEPNVQINNITYSGMATSFEIEKWYAWQVIAKDDNNYAAKSEVWVFKINDKSSINMIVDAAPFVKMKKYNPEKGIAQNGVLKLSYLNETSDTVAKINFIDLSSPEKVTKTITIPIKQGENLIKYNVAKELKFQKGKLYKAEIINSRNEKWEMLFEIYQYKK